MPVIKFLIGGPTDSWRQMLWEPYPNLSFEVGKFTGTLIDFFIISILMYVIYMKIIKKYEKQALSAQETQDKD
jgi:large-conductance mechanosensitive channel